jgi:hypothetical protein
MLAPWSLAWSIGSGQEGGVESGLPAVGDQTESERVAIEADRSIEDCNPEVHVPTRTAGWTASSFMACSLPPAAPAPSVASPPGRILLGWSLSSAGRCLAGKGG